MAQPNDIKQILAIQSNAREERAAQREAIQKELEEKRKRKRPGKYLPNPWQSLTFSCLQTM